MTVEKARQIFAELVACEYTNFHDDASWKLAAGVGDDEDRWENFCYWFKEVFGISWKEAENPRS